MAAPTVDAAAIERRLADWNDGRCAARARWRTSAALPSTVSDHPPEEDANTLKPAAVLIPLIAHASGLTMLFTQRSSELKSHAGQVSFPGGRIDAHETDPIAAALRETEEEIGLPRDRVRIIGRLGGFVTGTGYSITPIVGLITPPFELALNPAEVVDTFEVPLDFLLDRTNHEIQTARLRGRDRQFYVIGWRDRRIWGATAAMVVKFADMLLTDEAER